MLCQCESFAAHTKPIEESSVSHIPHASHMKHRNVVSLKALMTNLESPIAHGCPIKEINQSTFPWCRLIESYAKLSFLYFSVLCPLFRESMPAWRLYCESFPVYTCVLENVSLCMCLCVCL